MEQQKTFLERSFFFGDSRAAFLWLIVRVYVGYEWLMAGIEKLTNPVWVGAKSGVALTGFLNGSLAKTAGMHPDVQGWYASFLSSVIMPHATLWSHVVTYGEIAVGLGLIVGLCTTAAAFFGFFMNLNYLLAGTVSTNPILLVLSLLIMLARPVAGSYGLDRWSSKWCCK